MTAEIVFAPAADEDIADAYAWYERKRIGLGEGFLSAVEACIGRIRRSPYLAQPVMRDCRRALLRRFPYAVFYDCQDGIVTVHAVVHTSRDPNTWRTRLS